MNDNFLRKFLFSVYICTQNTHNNEIELQQNARKMLIENKNQISINCLNEMPLLMNIKLEYKTYDTLKRDISLQTVLGST